MYIRTRAAYTDITSGVRLPPHRPFPLRRSRRGLGSAAKRHRSDVCTRERKRVEEFNTTKPICISAAATCCYTRIACSRSLYNEAQTTRIINGVYFANAILLPSATRYCAKYRYGKMERLITEPDPLALAVAGKAICRDKDKGEERKKERERSEKLDGTRSFDSSFSRDERSIRADRLRLSQGVYSLN